MIHEYQDWTGINSLAVAKTNKPAVYIANGLGYHRNDSVKVQALDIRLKALPVDYFTICKQIIHGGLFFFDTNEECAEFFKLFNSAPLKDSELYACIYNQDGVQLLDNQT